MTKRVVTLVLCDLPHGEEVPAETLVVPLGRDRLEVDLCAAHRAEVLDPLVRVGRVVKAPGRKPAAGKS